MGWDFTFDDLTSAPAANRLSEMERLVAKDARNKQRIFPYIGGEEVNESPTHAHHRFAINFAEFPLAREVLGFTWQNATARQRADCLRDGIVPIDYPDPVAADWPDVLDVVKESVKPERDRLEDTGPDARRRKKLWWLWGRYTPGLYENIRDLHRVIAVSRVSAHFGFTFLPAKQIFSEQLIVVAADSFQMVFHYCSRECTRSGHAFSHRLSKIDCDIRPVTALKVSLSHREIGNN